MGYRACLTQISITEKIVWWNNRDSAICTNAPGFPCSNYFTVHRMIQEHIQMVQKVLSFWKGGALSSTKASFTGMAHSSCTLLRTVFPRMALSPAFHCARGIPLYAHPPETGHTPFHFMSPCATSSASFARWAQRPKEGVTHTHVFFFKYLQVTKIHVSRERGLETQQSSSYKCAHALPCASLQTCPRSSSLLSSLCTLQESMHSQIRFLCPHPCCLRTRRPPTQAHTEPEIVKAT